MLTYVFFAIASRSLTPDEYGEIVVLWSVVFLLASTLFRPIEHLLARTLAERIDSSARSGTRSARRRSSSSAIVVALIVGLLIAKHPIQDNLFERRARPLLGDDRRAARVRLAYYVRGFLAGRGQFPLYAALSLLEVVLRLAVRVWSPRSGCPRHASVRRRHRRRTASPA